MVAVMRAFSLAAAIVGCVVLAGACSSGDGSANRAAGSSTSTTAPQGSFADSGANAGWTLYGHDLSNTRFGADEREVNAGTVSTLRKRWSIDGLVGVTGTPVVSDGVAYFDDWTGEVRAVSAATGAPRWTTKIGGMFVAAPAVTGDAVYAAVGSALYKLDRATGAVEWKMVTDKNPYAQINASPVVVDGLVLQGTASFENIVNHEPYTFRGSIAAYDAQTGKLRWKFFTTKNTRDDGPGAGIWSTPAVDVRRGLLYVGTGQSLAPKTGPLADSLLAIDYRTGVLKWSRQFTYPDVFSAGHPGGKDADVGASPNLWTSNGRDLVGAGDKGGTFHALDRDTGQVVWQTRLAPGGAFGGEIGSAAFVDGTLVATSNIGVPGTNATTDTTKVFGLDPATGRILWSTQRLPGKVFAPVSAVPGVAFVGTDRGAMVALDPATGRRLWTYAAPAKTASGPSIVDGRVLWGYGFILFGAPGAGGVISFSPAS
jgi:polyvinyl alcohol dehydrogenase (cytochrome)